jgi:hypothetical protein
VYLQIPDRKKSFVGNDLIFSGDGGGGGDVDTDCVTWSDDNCPTDGGNGDNDDALILPTTSRTRRPNVE